MPRIKSRGAGSKCERYLYNLQRLALAKGGSVEVECSVMETEVQGSVPSVDWNVFTKYFSRHTNFSASVSETLNLDVGLLKLSVFPEQLIKSTPILHSFFFSALPLCRRNWSGKLMWRLKNKFLSTLGIEPGSLASVGEHSTSTPPLRPARYFYGSIWA